MSVNIRSLILGVINWSQIYITARILIYTLTTLSTIIFIILVSSNTTPSQFTYLPRRAIFHIFWYLIEDFAWIICPLRWPACNTILAVHAVTLSFTINYLSFVILYMVIDNTALQMAVVFLKLLVRDNIFLIDLDQNSFWPNQLNENI